MENWLAENHITEWDLAAYFQEDSDETSVTYAEALDEALCYAGSIGKKTNTTHDLYLQKFTPRRKKRLWSKVNTEPVERLIEAAKRKAVGLKEIEAAKQDSSWQQAYDSYRNMGMPEDFMRELKKNPKAKAFF
jgi:uncharacterized protein YdeI (YjbR/CyaY-like superfamily)